MTFRAWMKGENAYLITANTHEEACIKATMQARALETSNGTKRDSEDWVKYTTVVKTECLDQDSAKRWTRGAAEAAMKSYYARAKRETELMLTEE